MLTSAMELPKTQTKMINCWYLTMHHMEIYITIYQKILKKLLGKIKLIHFLRFHLGKVLIFIIIKFINKYLVK